ncbi:DHA2 family efflux MFS transporter permease subunit [Actinomadura darangshiensis]|uniref:DHA2 family efflux MFS transporter permease subunit n=1 Tax=Actinomadura darangshiensis TaxID=705336 RepID=A0A4V2YU28_9ACTN|nr:MFS transporter [Actinomadura darangshiensis]TDD76137.1 DHA2 family efflux MFS transporter permease subunit [Actinomadura darangshiensis]
MSELSPRRRFLVLAICSMSLLIVSLDNTILNVALPSLQHDFHSSLSGLQWTIDAYLIVLASLLILSGSTADRIGRRTVFQAGLALFVAGSVLCSLAPSLGWLVAARIVQAVGGSMLNPVAMSIITNVFTEPRERARAIGVWGAVVGLSMALGPLVGGLLVDSVGWRAIFWMNVPIGLAALALTALFVPQSRAARPRRLDPLGQVLMIAVFGTLTYSIIEAPGRGLADPVVYGAALLAAASLAGFVRHALRTAEPLIDLRFFRSVPFSGATVIAVSGLAALGGFLFLNTLYLQNVRGMSALQAGLYLLPMAAMTAATSPLSGRLIAARGPRLPLQIAGATMLASGLLFAAFDAETRDATLFTAYVLFGIGFGMLNSPITNTAVSGMPRAQAGVAAAVASTSRQVGQALGVAVIGAVLAAGASGSYAAPAFVSAARPAYWILAGCAATVLVLGTVTTGRRAARSAARTSALLGADDSVPDVRHETGASAR